MKKLILILLLILSSNDYAQISGKTQTGNLLIKKAPAIEEITSPKIVLIEPQFKDSSLLKVNVKSLTIKGKVIDNYGLQEITVNNIKIFPADDNSFSTILPLSTGVTSVNIKAINIKGKTGEINFNVSTDLDEAGPTVFIIEPKVSRGIKVVKKSDVVTVKGVATDVSGVLEVSVNNNKATLTPDGDFSIDMYLNIGDNKIVVKAIDRKLNTTIDTFTVLRLPRDIITPGKYIAVVIGVNSYSGYWPALKNAANDAEGVAEVLKKYYYFDSVYTILNQEATRKNIIHKFEWLTKSLTKNDNLLIFYAGHGQFNKEFNKGYWVPVDATGNSVADFISNNDVKTFLGGIPSKHTLLITDACFAGDIFRGKPTESVAYDPNNMEKYYQEVYRKQSRLALTSGGIEEVSDAGKDKHSIFTYYLIKALSENNRKYMDANQLFNEFRVAVTNNSEQTPMLQVVRDTDDEGGQFVFIRKDK